MGYIYLLILTVGFSFVGTCIKLSGLLVNAWVITFCRFALGVAFLFLFTALRRQKLRLSFVGFPIWLGIVGKCINYFCENYAVANGFSYGSVIVWPAQTIMAIVFAVFFLKEKISLRGKIGIFLCMAGIVFISWNGKSLAGLVTGEGAVYSLLLVIAGVGAACFTFAQKLLLEKMSTVDMNLSIFIPCSVITAIPIGFGGAPVVGGFALLPVLGLLMLGLLTGLGFLLTAEAMKTVPFYLVTVIQSANVVLALVWSTLFFHENITLYIICGTVIFIVGMLLINLRLPHKEKKFSASR